MYAAISLLQMGHCMEWMALEEVIWDPHNVVGFPLLVKSDLISNKLYPEYIFCKSWKVTVTFNQSYEGTDAICMKMKIVFKKKILISGLT